MRCCSPILVLLTIMLSFGCSSEGNGKVDPRNCREIIPKNLPGLEITGARPRGNVIRNLVPFICRVREQTAERRGSNPDLDGEILIRFTAEFQGEVTDNRIVETTVDDTLFMREFEHTMRFLEFDPWGDVDDETNVVYRIRLTDL